jgi:hypothetical protein
LRLVPSAALAAVVLAIVLFAVGAGAAATQEPPPSAAAPTPPGAAARPGPAVDENDDDDNDARRLRVNATARLDLAAGSIQVIYPLLPATGPDAAAIATLGEGEVLALTRSMAIKLKTEVEMRFDGGAAARPENVAEGYPGVYSLWLRRKGAGWTLVLNREPDIWGTMRDAAADVGEVDVTHREQQEDAPVLGVTLLQSNGGGQLEIAWGPHRWTADFEAGAGMHRSEVKSE